MYKELVTALRKRAVELPEKFSKNAENIDLLLKAADAIEKLQDRVAASEATIERQSAIIQAKDRDLQRAIDAKPQWIPVTERLPERGYYVLVYEDGDILMASYADGNWVLRDMYEVINDLKPTYWMPLPSAPTEE